ncbi:AMP-binding protein [Actinokineospora auranticolor]|uniref:AMP-binding enzyme n=1 Tax=Actinokineospora auranticolor TaxID=155976 RepID=A0A2S6GJS5_9PSEU|nr:AMP-binding protein [Actinokineospora auranticolor]PPK65453.1 AMP-binding enzyme [Actinokineospora auranticolor]
MQAISVDDLELARSAGRVGRAPAAFLAAVFGAAIGRHGGADSTVAAPVDWRVPFRDYLSTLDVPAEAPEAVWSEAKIRLVATHVEPVWVLELDHTLPAAYADGLLDSLHGALARVVADPDTPLADLFTDASAEQSRAADELWFRPPVWHLVGWLRRTAERRADSVAVEENGSRLTYRNLEEAVRATTAVLRARGARADDVVGLATDTLTDTVTTLLAVLRIGARYLLLPPTNHGDPLRRTGCRVVVGAAPPDGDDHPAGVTLLSPDDLIGAAGPLAEGERPQRAGGYLAPVDGGYVAMSAEPLFNLTAWQLVSLSMDHDSRVLASPGVDPGALFREVVPTLAVGGTVIARDRTPLAAQVVADRVTHVHLRDGVELPGIPLGHLRHVCVTGGEPGPDARVVRLFARPETQVALTARDGAALGRPITGVTAQVVDRTGHLAPPGVPGDLHLGGRCVADGYLADPGRTDDRFTPDPHGPAGARRFRTGLRVRWDDHGDLVRVPD